MRLATLTALCSLLAAPLLAAPNAHAQKMRPGLWENNVKLESASGEMEGAMARMQQEMARMPPEQRRQIEAMLAQQGVGMAVGKPNTARVCLTPEQAARDLLDTGDGRCQQTGHSRSGNTVRFTFTCQGGGMSGTGEGEFTLVSDQEHRGKMTIDMQRGGRGERMVMQTTGNWLGADCGDVKPRR